MDLLIAEKYYSREEIQKALLKYSRDREIAIKYDTYFGKRPMVIEYLSDIKQIIKNNPTSFHCSEERWLNPLLLGEKNIDNEKRNENRIGWDLILDLDGVDFEYAKILAKIIVNYLKNNLKIKNVSTKFSGNKGFHIGIPFEAFSSNIIGIGETRKLFPEVPRKIALFLMEELKFEISSEILKIEGSIEKIAKKFNFKLSDLKINDPKSNNLDYIKLIEIDTILITSRHLFRMPYSLNEKSGLVSIPIENDKIMEFKKEIAEPDNVIPEKYSKFEFLNYNENFGHDADILLLKAFEEINDEQVEIINSKIKSQKFGEEKGIIIENGENLESFEIKSTIELNDFPETIKYILKSNFEDGKKRAMFVLLTFLHSVNYNSKKIETLIFEWNNKQSNKLRDNIVQGQINWFNNLNKKITSPNYQNKEYYNSIGIPESIINKDINKFNKIKIKNPVHYVYVLLKQRELIKNLNNNKNFKNHKTIKSKIINKEKIN